jgi:hypothetical protein
MESLNALDRSNAQARQAELQQQHEEYLASHVEYRELLHDLMQAVLVHRPEDPLAFIQSQVQQLEPQFLQARSPAGGSSPLQKRSDVCA